MARRRRHELDEAEEGNERWLVSYSDMITVLMALFIVLFAMSQVDEQKYAALRDGLADSFGQTSAVMQGRSAVHEDTGSTSIAAPHPLDGADQISDPQLAKAVETALQQRRSRLGQEAEHEADRLTRVAEEIRQASRRAGVSDDIEMTIDHRGLVVSLVSRHVVFENDVATLSERGRQVIDAVAPVLARIEEPLEVDGHTNQVPVSPAFYATDWDLSSARAVTVVRYLDERWRIAPERLAAGGHGSTKPLRPVDEPGSQDINKRVDIVVLSTQPPEVTALLEEAARDRLGPDQEVLQP